MIDVCSWDSPGADRYMGDVPAAIAAYRFPAATQAALIEAFERRQFTDTVVIDRDSIRGKAHEYAPDIRSMHFGSRGRICNTVTRAKWGAEHAETAIVICAGAECIGIPAVCTNVFRITRLEPPTALVPPVYVEYPATPGYPGTPGTPLAAPLVPVVSWPPAVGVGPGGYGYGYGYGDGDGWFGGGGGSYFAPPVPHYFVDAPIPPVSEPAAWALLGAGIVAIAVTRRVKA